MSDLDADLESDTSLQECLSTTGAPFMNVFSYTRISHCCFCDLDLDPMTLTYKLDLDIIKMYLHTKNELSRTRLSKVRVQTGQTDRQTDMTERITTAAFVGDINQDWHAMVNQILRNNSHLAY